MEQLSCQVVSPCGQYRVQYLCDVRQSPPLLKLAVNHNRRAQSVVAQDPSAQSFSASLSEGDVENLTTTAGVVKDFKLFSLMLYNALLGKADCLAFSVKTYAQIRSQISGETETPSDLPPEAAQSLVFVLSYEVDFTRALFPIPLQPGESIRLHQHPASFDSNAPPTVSSPTEHRSGSVGSTGSVPRVVYDKENALQLRVESLERENRALKEANERLHTQNKALERLSKEKLAEMTKQCEVIETHMGAHNEVKRLRAEATALSRRLREEQQTSSGLRREVDRLRARLPASARPSYPTPTRGTTPPRSSSAGRYSTSPRSGQRNSGDSPLPRGRSTSRPGYSPSKVGYPVSRPQRSSSRDSASSVGSRRSISSANSGRGAPRLHTANRFRSPPTTPTRSRDNYNYTNYTGYTRDSGRFRSPPKQPQHHRPIFR